MGSSERSRGRRSNGKGPKKQPQRGLGVEQLEKLRMQECLKKAAEASGIPIPSTLHHHQYYHQHLLQCHCQYHHHHHPQVFASDNNVPVRYGTPIPSPPNGFHHCPHPIPQQVMINHSNNSNSTIAAGSGGFGYGPFIGNKNGLNNMLGGVGGGACYNSRVASSSSSHYGSGSLHLRNPLETSKELSSMPNLHSDQSFDPCLKRRDRPMEVWSNNMHDTIQGFVPQPAAPNNFAAAAASAYATPNHDEIVAVHRRGNSVNGKVFMEYEFFPGKDGRAAGTTSKELEFSTIGGSVDQVGGGGGSSEASSSITVYGDAPPSNYIDLSLKL